MNYPTAVVGATLYKNNKKIADDVEFTTPEVAFTTVEVQGLGTIEVPIYSMTDNLQLEITQNGVDSNLVNYIEPGINKFEFRWVQNFVTPTGTQIYQGCKMFVNAMPISIPSLGVKKGENTERTHTFNLTRMQVYVSGKELCLIDKLSNIMKINGKDYISEINKLL